MNVTGIECAEGTPSLTFEPSFGLYFAHAKRRTKTD